MECAKRTKYFKLCVAAFTSFVFVNFSTGLFSCSNLKHVEGNIVGDVDKIDGEQSGATDYYWIAEYKGINLTSEAKWHVCDEKYHFDFLLNKKSNKIAFSWHNLPSGVHTFQLVAQKTTKNESITFFSKTIYLNIFDKAYISGGSTNINSTSTNHEEKIWKVTFKGKDFSQSAKWSLKQTEYQDKITINYSEEKKGTILSWKNLDIGEYNFQLVAVIDDYLAPNTIAYSQPIKLTICELIGCIEGSVTLEDTNNGADEKAWKIVYNKTNYSNKAEWWIEQDNPSNASISVAYSGEENGAIVSWKNLDVGTYKFIVWCKFEIDGKTIFGSSPLVTLSIFESGEIVGGSTNLFGNSSGYDKNLWSFFYLGVDRTKDAKFYVEKKKATNDIDIHYDELHNGIRVFWNNFASSQDNTYIIKCEYVTSFGKKIIGRTPYIHLHTNIPNVFGGTTELWGEMTGGEDGRYWSVTYNDIDYTSSKNTVWSLEAVDPKYEWFLNYIKIVSKNQLVYIKWSDFSAEKWFHLDENTCIFKVKANFLDIYAQRHIFYSYPVTYHFTISDLPQPKSIFKMASPSTTFTIKTNKQQQIYTDEFGWYAAYNGITLDNEQLSDFYFNFHDPIHSGDTIDFTIFYDPSVKLWYIGWKKAHFASSYSFSFYMFLHQKCKNNDYVIFKSDLITFMWIQ